MQSVRSYLDLSALRLPGWSELRDGSFLNRALKKTESSTEVSIIKDFEVRRVVNIKLLCSELPENFFQGKLVKVQEVAIWSSPGVSLVWILLTQVWKIMIIQVKYPLRLHR